MAVDPHDASIVVVDDPAAPSETTEGSNPRKRKKSSRACDFCHINHQPCDNAKPRCSYCERHGKSCLYLRPQKKRGPAQGYRSALHTMRESAAAWGAALNLIPSLGPVIEGYLKKEEGKRLVKAIKDPQQQEFFIQAWQQSNVFKSFFGDEDASDGGDAADGGDGRLSAAPSGTAAATSGDADAESANSDSIGVAAPQQLPLPPPPITTTLADSSANNSLPTSYPSSLPGASIPPAPSLLHHGTPVSFPLHDTSLMGFDPKFDPLLHQHAPTPSPSQDGTKQSRNGSVGDLAGASTSLSDIVARDAARSSNSFSQTLGSLGFAPDETLNDFLALSYNPDPIDNTANHDPLLGSEMDQKAYYELLMGKRFT